jgi:hypothetical protein
MSVIEDLEELPQLRDNGVLTNEEPFVRRAMLLRAGVPIELDE